MTCSRWQKIIVVGLTVLFLTDRPASDGCFIGSVGAASPSDVLLTTLAWQASPSPEATGYIVYYRVADFAVTNRLEAGKSLTATLPLCVGVTYLIYVVAHTEEGVESEPSNLLRYTPPPMTPVRLVRLDGGGLQIRFRTSPLALCRVEWTDDLAAATWRMWVTVRAGLNGDIVLTDPSVATATAQARFYRAVRL